jgi:hypothetical protein
LKPNKIVNKGNSVFRGRNEDDGAKLNQHSMPKNFGRDPPRIAGGVPQVINAKNIILGDAPKGPTLGA